MSVNPGYFKGIWEQIMNDGHAWPNKMEWMGTKIQKQRFKPITGVVDMSYINGLYVESIKKYPR